MSDDHKTCWKGDGKDAFIPITPFPSRLQMRKPLAAYGTRPPEAFRCPCGKGWVRWWVKEKGNNTRRWKWYVIPPRIMEDIT